MSMTLSIVVACPLDPFRYGQQIDRLTQDWSVRGTSGYHVTTGPLLTHSFALVDPCKTLVVRSRVPIISVHHPKKR